MSLGYEAPVPYYPCNDVQTDHAGNLVISNLTLNVGTTPLVLLSVDKTTGALTEVASVTFSGLEESRIDHCAVAGDVKSGDFSVFACPRYSTKLLRWQFRGGKLASQQSVTMKGYAHLTPPLPASRPNSMRKTRISCISTVAASISLATTSPQEQSTVRSALAR